MAAVEGNGRERGQGVAASGLAAPTAASQGHGGSTDGGATDLELYQQMLLIRRFEEAVQRLFQKGEIHGTTHLYSGQEAGAVGVCSGLRDGDRVAGTYRGHGHAIAIGVDPQLVLDELLGRESGVCGGRAGSMNLVALEQGLIGCYGIVGGSIAAATGVGLAFSRQGSESVAVAFFGEGTANQAYFAECLNFAQVERLPVVFVCENNRYMEFTPIEEVTAGSIRERAAVLGLRSETVDGMDLWAVRDAAAEAIDHARSGAGPAFIETLTYRFVGHSRSDPGAYRKPGELEEMRERDPLTLARERLLSADRSGEEAIAEIDERVERRIEELVERALAAPFPQPAAATEFKGPESGDGVLERRVRGDRRVPVSAELEQGARIPAEREHTGAVSGELEFRTAIRDALDEELARDQRVLLFGEDVAAEQGGVFAVTPGLQGPHGPSRVFDTPISELAIAGAAYGSAITGMRPVIEIMFGDFLPLAMDSLVNQAAKYWYISKEQGSVPLVVRSAIGGGGRFGAIHSQSPISWLQGVPGLKIVAPSSPAEAKSLLKASIRDDNPVLFLEHKRLYSAKGPEPSEEALPLGVARVVRGGSDLTMVSVAKGVGDCVEAAERLAAEGIDAEVLDLRSLRPLDIGAVIQSVARTNRIVAVEEGPRLGGWAANLLGIVAEEALEELDDAWTIVTEETPIPYSPPLEDAFLRLGVSIAENVTARLHSAGDDRAQPH